MENEIWKSIVGYEGLYEISNLGQVRSLPRIIENFGIHKQIKYRGCILKKFLFGDVKKERAYYAVRLCKNSKSKSLKIHRLIAIHFIENPNNYEWVNHKDGNKLNNNIDNLEWCSASYNQKHAYDLGLRKKILGSNAPWAVLTENIVKKIKMDLASKINDKELANKYNVSISNIRHIKKGRIWKHVA